MSKPSVSITAGRLILSLVGVLTAIGGFLADWNETHVFNPRWPPHAKFHNGQTMSMGLALGLATLYYTWRPQYNHDSLFTAALLGSIYWITQASAILYPGSEFIDPEFGTYADAPQPKGIAVLLGAISLGYWLESRRMASGKIGKD